MFFWNYGLQTAYCCIFGDVGQEGILLSTACTKCMKWIKIQNGSSIGACYVIQGTVWAVSRYYIRKACLLQYLSYTIFPWMIVIYLFTFVTSHFWTFLCLCSVTVVYCTKQNVLVKILLEKDMASTYVNFVGNFWINLYCLYHIFQNHIKSDIKLGLLLIWRGINWSICVMTKSKVSKISKWYSNEIEESLIRITNFCIWLLRNIHDSITDPLLSFVMAEAWFNLIGYMNFKEHMKSSYNTPCYKC